MEATKCFPELAISHKEVLEVAGVHREQGFMSWFHCLDEFKLE